MAASAPTAETDRVVLFPDIGRPIVDDPPDVHLFDAVVHQLRQPLTVIRGQLQLGRRQIGKDAERVRDTIDIAVAQVDRMSRLLTTSSTRRGSRRTPSTCAYGPSTW